MYSRPVDSHIVFGAYSEDLVERNRRGFNLKEIIESGKNLDEIKNKWIKKWNCSPDQIVLKIIKKPNFFRRKWIVKISLKEKTYKSVPEQETKVIWNGEKYLIFPGNNIKKFVPFPLVGKIIYNGQEMFEEFAVAQGHFIEFYPVTKIGHLILDLKIYEDGSKAIVIVNHEHPGQYVLIDKITETGKLFLEKCVEWKPGNYLGEVWSKERLDQVIAEKGIIHGIKQNYWEEILAVDGTGEVVIAEQTPPVPPVHPRLKDYVGEPLNRNQEIEKIDYFGCKFKICDKDELLAKKIPGSEGVPGVDIFGRPIPAERMKDFQFRPGQNVYLSPDGLEVRALRAGLPVRLDDYTYIVENVYVAKEVDLGTGSIDFPGNVFVSGDVTEGFFVNSNNKIFIQGSAYGASLKAENGIIVNNNVIACNILLGETYVLRSQLVEKLQDLDQGLTLCFNHIALFLKEKNKQEYHIGKILKLLLERKFKDLPEKAQQAVKIIEQINAQNAQLISKELFRALVTVSNCLTGYAPLKLDKLRYIKNVQKLISNFISTGTFFSQSVTCQTGYVQKSSIECSGDFICRSDVYNCYIRAEGNIRIFGVCRGSKIICGNRIFVQELGSPSYDNTLIVISETGHLTAKYCYPNVKIIIGKKVIPIREAVRNLDVYTESGTVWVDKLKWQESRQLSRG